MKQTALIIVLAILVGLLLWQDHLNSRYQWEDARSLAVCKDDLYREKMTSATALAEVEMCREILVRVDRTCDCDGGDVKSPR